MNDVFKLQFTARFAISVDVDAYSVENVPKEVEEDNAKEVLIDALRMGVAETAVTLLEGPERDFEQENQFWQVQDSVPGCLPDSAFVYDSLDTAKEYAKHLAEEYKDSDNVVEDISEEGGEVYVVRRESDPSNYQRRIITVEGPMTAQDMGYDTIEQMYEFEF